MRTYVNKEEGGLTILVVPGETGKDLTREESLKLALEILDWDCGLDAPPACLKVNDLKNLFPRFNVDTFEHVLGHVSKAAGKLHGLVGDMEHIQNGRVPLRRGAFSDAEEENGKAASVYIADLIICAAKLAEIRPSGEFDLEKAILHRMAEKRNYLNKYKKASE